MRVLLPVSLLDIFLTRFTVGLEETVCGPGREGEGGEG